jgi:hypothetical protein
MLTGAMIKNLFFLTQNSLLIELKQAALFSGTTAARYTENTSGG